MCSVFLESGSRKRQRPLPQVEDAAVALEQNNRQNFQSAPPTAENELAAHVSGQSGGDHRNQADTQIGPAPR